MIGIKEERAEGVENRHVAKVVEIDVFEAAQPQLLINEIVYLSGDVEPDDILNEGVWIHKCIFDLLDSSFEVRHSLVDIDDFFKAKSSQQFCDAIPLNRLGQVRNWSLLDQSCQVS